MRRQNMNDGTFYVCPACKGRRRVPGTKVLDYRNGDWKTQHFFAAYRDRAGVLRTLGFASYGAYLASPLWKNIRRAVLHRAGHICEACRNFRANQVHHTDYSLAVMAGDDLSKLVAICRECHEAIEFGAKGKVDLDTANSRLKKIDETLRSVRRQNRKETLRRILAD